jgi:hypothetical protein
LHYESNKTRGKSQKEERVAEPEAKSVQHREFELSRNLHLPIHSPWSRSYLHRLIFVHPFPKKSAAHPDAGGARELPE